MRLTIKEYFKQFLHAYVAEGHTVCDESEQEVNRFTDEFTESLTNDDCFNSSFIYDYVDYIEHNLSDEYIGLYTLYFDNHRYVCLLEKYICHLFD